MNQVIKKNFEIDKTKAKRLRSMGISGLFLQINKKNEQSSSKTPQNIDNLNIKEVKNIVQECQSCELHKTRNMSVFGEGNENAQIMFIGEAPGKDEDMTGQPFVGRAGQLLDRIIQAMKMKREDIYICNTVKCRPENNRKPTVDEVKSCSSFLDFQIKKVNPKIIICLGLVAAEYILGENDKLKNLRGKFYERHGAKILITYHPAALLRDPSKKKLVWEDMQIVMKEVGIDV
ncbi:MAG: uracil-DNA glycosylase [Thermodesulfobacteriota bacterium]|nr:uracil-DNA glycosylase [Thermodesulfobacteriota bacterium]